MRISRWVTTGLLVILSLAALPHPGYAAPPAQNSVSGDRERALKAEGDAAMDALRYDDALAAYRGAYAISKNPALLYNQSRALQSRGDYAASLTYLERFDAEASAELKARGPGLPELEAALRARVTLVTVTCNVPGAEILLRGERLGTAPLAAPVRATYGQGAVSAAAPKYQPQTKEVDLPGGGALTLDFVLQPIALTGVLVVRSVAGAQVMIDGRDAGGVPLEMPLAPGRHALTVSRSGYETARTTVVVAAGERNPAEVPLLANAPIYAKWWFWAGIGTAVAAGVLTFVLVTTERAADQGTVAPGRVSGPLVTF